MGAFDDEKTVTDFDDVATEVEPILPERRVLGRYRLCYELASGGMGTVYLARAEGIAGFDKLVALKCIHPQLAKEKSFVDMFLDEARLAAHINHANVCNVFDVGCADGVYYLAMEFLLGETIARYMRVVTRRGADVSIERRSGFAARIVADACEGLHAAHELTGDRGQPLGLVHRDISPQNLFLGYDGVIKVMDFGIAQAAGRIHHTRPGTLKGKVAYMAPEQLLKVPLDRRADVFAAGVVLWEMLVGKRLFRKEAELDTLVALANDPIPAPSTVRKGVPEALDAIVLEALSRDRDQRYPTARAFGRDLHRVLGTLPDPVTPADLAEFAQDLFRVERARRMALVEQSRHSLPGPATRVAADEGSQSSVRAVAPLELVPTRSLAVPKVPEPEPSETSVHLAAPKQTLLLTWGAGAAGLAVLALIVIAIVAAAGDDEEDAARAIQLVPRVTAPMVVPAQEAAPLLPPAPAGAPTPSRTRTRTQTRTQTRAQAETRTRTRTPAPAPAPEREEPTKTRAPSEPGTLVLVTPGGWADLTIDGRRVGRTPIRLSVAPGSHRLELRPFGNEPTVTRRVNVPSGGELPLSIRLRR